MLTLTGLFRFLFLLFFWLDDLSILFLLFVPLPPPSRAEEAGNAAGVRQNPGGGQSTEAHKQIAIACSLGVRPALLPQKDQLEGPGGPPECKAKPFLTGTLGVSSTFHESCSF